MDKFLEFISKADRLRQSQDETPTIAAFREFVQKAERIVVRPPSSPPPLAKFHQFIKLAIPLVVEVIKTLMPRMAERAVLAERWLTPHDLLSVAGFSFIENFYTELAAWALHPSTHHSSAQARQQAWLKVVGLDEDIYSGVVRIPTTQLVTDDGIVDLVLHFENATVVVEAKTGSTEHAAPVSGEPQSIAYPKAVRRTLGLLPDHKVPVVFITPDRRPAANPEAKLTTFVEFVFAIATLLDNEKVPPDDNTRAAFAMLFTHLLTCATTTRVPGRELIERISEWSQQPDWVNDEWISKHRNVLLEAADFLIPEKHDER